MLTANVGGQQVAYYYRGKFKMIGFDGRIEDAETVEFIEPII